LINWLLERMAGWKKHPAIAGSDWVASYGELLDLTEMWQKSIAEKCIKTGQVVALCGDYNPQTCSLLLALINTGAIIVPITRASDVHKEEFMDIAEVEMIISDNGDWSFENRPVVVSNPLTLKLREQGEPGLVMFSSGSTGKSKAILHSFNQVLEKFKVPRQGLVTLTFLLLDHMGGINTLFHTFSNGGTVVPVDSRNPDMVCETIARYRVEILPTSPTFLNLLLISGAYEHYDMSSLRLITYGTEVMPESTLQRAAEVFPNVKFQQTYGLSELGVLRSKSRENNSLWVKVGGEGFETKVVDGILWVRARSAMLGYLNAPSPFDADGWMCTEDAVEVDGEYIKILGRKSDIINVGGQKVYPAEVENVILKMPDVADVVAYQDGSSLLNTVGAKIQLISPEPLGDLKKRLRAFCKGKLAPYKIPVRIEIVDRDMFSSRYKKMRGEKKTN